MVKTFTKISFILVLFFGISSCTYTLENTVKIKVKNNSEKATSNVLVSLKTDQLKLNQSTINWNNVVIVDKEIVPAQMVDRNNDNIPDIIFALLDFKAGEEKEIIVRELKKNELKPEFNKRTQAELAIKKGGTFKNVTSFKVPVEHTNHSFEIKYEGPGWESDKVAYRFYLDWRNAVDIFGKKTSNMVLQDVGQNGADSYHEECDWGMDILKVGSSLGMGSIGYWDGSKAVRIEKTDSTKCSIMQNGLIKSCIKTNYYGWNYSDSLNTNLELFTSISAGSRLTTQKLLFDKAPLNICSGIVKHINTKFIKSENENSKWAYIATFGIQSLNKDNLGMVVFYKTANLLQITEDEHSHVVILKPSDNKIDYCFAATWDKDIDQIDTKQKFVDYLNNTLDALNNPPTITYNN